MSDFIIAQIRTYTPMLVGFVVSWLVSVSLIDPATSAEAAAGLTAFFTALFGGVYYFLVRWLAEKWPSIGILLGYNKAPEYNES